MAKVGAGSVAAASDSTVMLEPVWSFRQDDNSTTLIVEVAGIDRDSMIVHFEPRACYLRFTAAAAAAKKGRGKGARAAQAAAGEGEERLTYELLLGPPAPMTMKAKECTYVVDKRNMLVTMPKSEPERWTRLVVQSVGPGGVVVSDRQGGDEEDEEGASTRSVQLNLPINQAARSAMVEQEAIDEQAERAARAAAAEVPLAAVPAVGGAGGALKNQLMFELD